MHHVTVIGVLSDTHGTLHPRVVGLFREARVEQILHAGDVGDFGVIPELSAIAPVLAVRGNIDDHGRMGDLPAEIRLELQGISIFMTHIGAKPYLWLPKVPQPRPAVAICGHSHIPLLEEAGGVLFLNPGAAGTRPRFGRPLTAALLRIADGQVEGEIVDL